MHTSNRLPRAAEADLGWVNRTCSICPALTSGKGSLSDFLQITFLTVIMWIILQQKGLLQNAAALFCYPVVLPLRDICTSRADFSPNWAYRCNEKLCRQRMQKNRGCILQQPLTGSLEIFLHLILWNTFLLAAKVGAWKTLKKHLRYFIWNHYTFSPDPIIFLCIKSF